MCGRRGEKDERWEKDFSLREGVQNGVEKDRESEGRRNGGKGRQVEREAEVGREREVG